MNIVFILPGSGSSGGVRCTSIVAQQLQVRGHRVRLVCRKADRNVRDWGRAIQAKILYRTAPVWIHEFSGPVDYFTNISDCRFDPEEILVAVGMSECAQLARLGSLTNTKIQYIHGSTPFSPELVDQALSLRLPKIVVASYLKDLVAGKGHADEVIAVIHNGIDPNAYFPCVPESQRNGVGIVYSGHPSKDPATVLSVLARLASSRPNVPLYVFGADRRPKQIGSSRYWRSPSLKQAREIYSRSLVWVVASRSEGFSLPILEAMACGCAVVATDCGGPSDQIKDGENGFLVPVGDIDSIVNRVQLLLDNSTVRTTVRQQAQQTIQRFTWGQCVDRLESALRRAVHADNAKPAECTV